MLPFLREAFLFHLLIKNAILFLHMLNILFAIFLVFSARVISSIVMSEAPIIIFVIVAIIIIFGCYFFISLHWHQYNNSLLFPVKLRSFTIFWESKLNLSRNKGPEIFYRKSVLQIFEYLIQFWNFIIYFNKSKLKFIKLKISTENGLKEKFMAYDYFRQKAQCQFFRSKTDRELKAYVHILTHT